MGPSGEFHSNDENVRLQVRIAELEEELSRLRSSSAEDSVFFLIRGLMEHAPVGFALLDTDFCYRIVNEKLAAMNRVSAAAHIGHTVEEIAPTIAVALHPAFDHVIATGKSLVNVESSRETGASGERWLGSLFPLRASDGQLLGVASFVTGITEQKRAVEEASLNQQTLEMAQAAAGMGSWEWDLRTNEVHCSPEYGPLYGLPRGTHPTYGQWLDLLHPEDRQRIASECERVLAGPNQYLWEFRTVWPDGSVHWILSKGRVHCDAGGTPTRCFGVIMDITERKHAEQVMRIGEQAFREMADAAPVMICASGPDRKVTFFNKGWLHFTGRMMEEALDEGWLQDVHPDDREAALAEIGAAFESRRYCQVEYRLRRADGEYRWLLCHGTPRFGVDGEFTGFVASAIDTTDLKHSHEAELVRQKMASVGAVAMGVAHDLSNLLSGVMVQAELLQSELPAGSSAQIGVARLNLVASRAIEIAQQLLTYAADDKTVFEPLDVSKLVRDMLELLKVSISKRATLNALLATNLPPVRGNASQLRQVVLNLVTNASEALGIRNGTITVTTESEHLTPSTSPQFEPTLAEGDYIRLEVSDTGGGMSDETRAQIFDPFFTTKVKGRGLGLAVVQRIVRGHGGGVRVTSRPGGGSRFEVLLPCIPASGVESETPSAASAPIEPGATEGGILLVDDEIMLLAPVAEMLRKEGFTVFEAADGRSALITFAAHRNRIGVVLLDLVMPEISGIEVLAELRLLQPHVRVILTTAYTQKELRSDFAEHKSWAFLRKPYSLSELLDLVRRALKG